MDSISASATNENVFLFVFIASSVSFGICIYVQCSFDTVRKKLQTENVC